MLAKKFTHAFHYHAHCHKNFTTAFDCTSSTQTSLQDYNDDVFFSKLGQKIDDAREKFLVWNSNIIDEIWVVAETYPFTDAEQQKIISEYNNVLKKEMIKKAIKMWQKMFDDYTKARTIPHEKKRKKRLKVLDKRLKSKYMVYLKVESRMFNLGSTITAEQLAFVLLHWNPFKYDKTDFESDDKI